MAPSYSMNFITTPTSYSTNITPIDGPGDPNIRARVERGNYNPFTLGLCSEWIGFFRTVSGEPISVSCWSERKPTVWQWRVELIRAGILEYLAYLDENRKNKYKTNSLSS